MTRWDNLHERFFSFLSTLAFDKAKELLDRDGHKMTTEFLPDFHLLVQYERAYHSFGFVVGPKGNLSSVKRDKSLYQCYSDLYFSFSKAQIASAGQMNTNENKDTISSQQLFIGLIAFLNCRINLMKLYERISTAVKSNEHNVRLENYLSEILNISQMDMSSMDMLILNPLRQLIKYEVDCLLLLIQSHVFISDYQYMNSISTLHHMHCILKEWNDSIENHQNTNYRFQLSSSSALNFFKSPTKPALFIFFLKFHELLVAKFTLYFTDTLCEYSGLEAKAPLGKIPDFTTRIAQFYRRSNVEWIMLILLETKEPAYTNPTINLVDFNLPSKSITSANHGKPYHIIFGYPNKPNSSDEITQQILTKIEINQEMLSNGDKTFYNGDTHHSKTFFLQNIDPRITLALVFASYRQERDTAITNFLTELLDSLRGSRHLLSFKNATK